MKTLNNHTIIYDEECPMCHAYTHAFIQAKMLDNEGRIAFSEMPEELSIDRVRACNEIALIDRRSGNVTYGIDSLLLIIGHNFPLVAALFRWPPFHKAMKRCYALISYNRKVIAPGKVFEPKGTCIPQFHVKYRWAYIAFAWAITSLISSNYAPLLVPYIPKDGHYREFMICAGQIIFQGTIVFFLKPSRVVHYIGNMATISLAGALALLPALLLHALGLSENNVFYLLWFGIVVSLMFMEHIRRTKYLEINGWTTVSWVIYRLIILALIFFINQ